MGEAYKNQNISGEHQVVSYHGTENEIWLEALLENTLTGIIILKPIRGKNVSIINFECLFANEKAEQTLNLPGVTGRKILDDIPEIMHTGIFDRCVDVAETGVPWEGEIYFETMDAWHFMKAVKLNDGCLLMYSDITNQKSAEQELSERKNADQVLLSKDEPADKTTGKYMSLFNNMDQGFCIVEMIFDEEDKPVDYRFMEINPAFEKQTGLKNAVGKTALELIPSLSKEWIRIYGEIEKTGIPVHLEIQLSDLAGSWYDVHAFRIDNPEKHQVAMLFNDISEKKKEEENYLSRLENEVKQRTAELNESKELIEQITNISPDLITIHENDTKRIIFSNSGSCQKNVDKEKKMYFLDEEKRIRRRIHPDDRKKAFDFFRKRTMLADREILEIEMRNLMKNQTWGWIRERSKVFKRDAEGKITQIITFASDISPQKEVELKLKDQSHLIQQITDTTPDILYVVDLVENRIVYMNKGITSALGFTPDEIYAMEGKFFETIFNPDDYERIMADFAKVVSLKSEEIIVSEFRIKDLNGNFHWLNVRYTIFKTDENGSPIQILGIGQDISEKKEAEEAFHKERTLNVELKRMNELLDTFVFAAAHDLKAPVSNLKLLTSVINSSTDTEIKLQLQNKYNSIIDTLETTISGLVSVLEVEKHSDKGIRKLEFQDIYISVFNELHEKIISIKPEITINFLACPTITYVETYLISIFRNLLSNALKYRAIDRKCIIEIESGRSGEFILLTLRDNGIGINMEFYRDDMFKPFKRFTKQEGGTGIGLHLVKRIVTKNGGRIEVESEEDEGTVFRVFLSEYNNKNL